MLKDLFDVEMRNFITPVLLQILYAIGILGGGLVGAFLVVRALVAQEWGLAAVVVVAYVLGLVVLRVNLEFIGVLFRIAENTAPRTAEPPARSAPTVQDHQVVQRRLDDNATRLRLPRSDPDQRG